MWSTETSPRKTPLDVPVPAVVVTGPNDAPEEGTLASSSMSMPTSLPVFPAVASTEVTVPPATTGRRPSTTSSTSASRLRYPQHQQHHGMRLQQLQEDSNSGPSLSSRNSNVRGNGPSQRHLSVSTKSMPSSSLLSLSVGSDQKASRSPSPGGQSSTKSLTPNDRTSLIPPSSHEESMKTIAGTAFARDDQEQLDDAVNKCESDTDTDDSFSQQKFPHGAPTVLGASTSGVLRKSGNVCGAVCAAFNAVPSFLRRGIAALLLLVLAAAMIYSASPTGATRSGTFESHDAPSPSPGHASRSGNEFPGEKSSGMEGSKMDYGAGWLFATDDMHPGSNAGKYRDGFIDRFTFPPAGAKVENERFMRQWNIDQILADNNSVVCELAVLNTMQCRAATQILPAERWVPCVRRIGKAAMSDVLPERCTKSNAWRNLLPSTSPRQGQGQGNAQGGVTTATTTTTTSTTTTTTTTTTTENGSSAENETPLLQNTAALPPANIAVQDIVLTPPPTASPLTKPAAKNVGEKPTIRIDIVTDLLHTTSAPSVKKTTKGGTKPFDVGDLDGPDDASPQRKGNARLVIKDRILAQMFYDPTKPPRPPLAPHLWPRPAYGRPVPLATESSSLPPSGGRGGDNGGGGGDDTSPDISQMKTKINAHVKKHVLVGSGTPRSGKPPQVSHPSKSSERMSRNTATKADRNVRSQEMIDSPKKTTPASTTAMSGATVTGQCFAFPISYALPKRNLVKPKRYKDRQMGFLPLLPNPFMRPKMWTYHGLQPEDEWLMDSLLQRSAFAPTQRRGGWDCLRHYEALFNGAVPYFVDLQRCPANTLTAFPKDLILRTMSLRGVTHIGQFLPRHGQRRVGRHPAWLRVKNRPYVFWREIPQIDDEKFVGWSYDDLVGQIYEHTKKHLTTEGLAAHIIRQTIMASPSTGPKHAGQDVTPPTPPPNLAASGETASSAESAESSTSASDASSGDEYPGPSTPQPRQPPPTTPRPEPETPAPFWDRPPPTETAAPPPRTDGQGSDSDCGCSKAPRSKGPRPLPAHPPSTKKDRPMPSKPSDPSRPILLTPSPWRNPATPSPAVVPRRRKHSADPHRGFHPASAPSTGTTTVLDGNAVTQEKQPSSGRQLQAPVPGALHSVDDASLSPSKPLEEDQDRGASETDDAPMLNAALSDVSATDDGTEGLPSNAPDALSKNGAEPDAPDDVNGLRGIPDTGTELGHRPTPPPTSRYHRHGKHHRKNDGHDHGGDVNLGPQPVPTGAPQFKPSDKTPGQDVIEGFTAPKRVLVIPQPGDYLTTMFLHGLSELRIQTDVARVPDPKSVSTEDYWDALFMKPATRQVVSSFQSNMSAVEAHWRQRLKDAKAPGLGWHLMQRIDPRIVHRPSDALVKQRLAKRAYDLVVFAQAGRMPVASLPWWPEVFAAVPKARRVMLDGTESLSSNDEWPDVRDACGHGVLFKRELTGQ